MTGLRHAALIAAMTGFLTAQAHAGEGGFSKNDLNTLFEGLDKPMQLMALSQQEMEKTEGAVYRWAIYYAYIYAPQLGAAAMMAYAYNSAPRIGSTINYI